MPKLKMLELYYDKQLVEHIDILKEKQFISNISEKHSMLVKKRNIMFDQIKELEKQQLELENDIKYLQKIVLRIDTT